MHSITHHGSNSRNMLVIMVRENTSGHESLVTGLTEYGSVSSRTRKRTIKKKKKDSK